MLRWTHNYLHVKRQPSSQVTFLLSNRGELVGLAVALMAKYQTSFPEMDSCEIVVNLGH